MLKKIKELVRGLLFLPKYKKVKRNYYLAQDPKFNINDKPVMMEAGDLISAFIYKDENWNYIKNRSEYRMSIKAGNPKSYTDNVCGG